MYECRWGAGLWGEVEGAGGALTAEAKSAEVGAGGRQTTSPLLGQCWVHPRRGSRRAGNEWYIYVASRPKSGPASPSSLPLVLSPVPC